MLIEEDNIIKQLQNCNEETKFLELFVKILKEEIITKNKTKLLSIILNDNSLDDKKRNILFIKENNSIIEFVIQMCIGKEFYKNTGLVVLV